MPKAKSSKSKKASKEVTTLETPKTSGGLLERLQTDIEKNNSFLNLILGALIVIVLGVLIFNYFNRGNEDLGPSQNTLESPQASDDVSKEDLPGNYTVKTGDTLFTIAEKYYGDGYKYSVIVEENGLANENAIEVGKVLEIPKLETDQPTSLAQANPSLTPSPSPSPSASLKPSVTPTPTASPAILETKKAPAEVTNQTVWGEKITGNTYTVQSGDWLSTIAGRAYGDIMDYQKIAQANNIPNPDLIEPGTVLKLPR